MDFEDYHLADEIWEAAKMHDGLRVALISAADDYELDEEDYIEVTES